MTERVKGILVGFLALGLASGVVGRCCCAQPALKACCGKHHPAPAKGPCPQMVSCRVALSAGTDVSVPATKALPVVLPDHGLVPATDRRVAIEAAQGCGPPERPREAYSGLSPPPSRLG